jgi:hypothetical protein
MSKGGQGVNVQELLAFQHEVEQHLGATGDIVSFGVSKILRLGLRGRCVDIGTNGSYLWLTADLRWDGFPEGALLAYAPEGSYRRAKMLEGSPDPVMTGDQQFDKTYLLLGSGATQVMAAISAEVRRTLLESIDLRPEIRGVEIGGEPIKATRRVHIRSEPDLSVNGRGSSYVELGAERFTPKHAAEVAQRLTTSAERLEEALA